MAGTACASIASEAPKEAPIVIWGGGPRVRVYCVFDEDAITQDGVNEDALPKSPDRGRLANVHPISGGRRGVEQRKPCRRIEQGFGAIGGRRCCG